MMEQPQKQIQVLIVNDSGYMRKYLTDLITSDEIKVSNTGIDGEDALNKLSLRKPDVILLDLEMPKMDGLTFIEKMLEKGELIPTIIASSFSEEGTKIVFDALEHGAVDFVQLSQDMQEKDTLQNLLIAKIKMAANSDPSVLIQERIMSLKPKRKISPRLNSSERLVIIGASTGGPNTVQKVLSGIPHNIDAGILIVQHMPKGFTKQFANRLQTATGFSVKEAEEGDVIRDGQVFLAPGDYHMIVKPGRKIHLDSSEKRFGVRPSVNMTMISASEIFGANIVGVVLTGMGHDGGFGMKSIKNRGGYTIVQNKETCVIYGMPKSVVDLGAANDILPLDKISTKILDEVKNLSRT